MQQAAGTVDEAVRFAAPVAVGRICEGRRLRDERHRQRGLERADNRLALDAGEVDRLALARTPVAAPLVKRRAMRLREQRDADVAPRLDIVRGDQQLAE